MPCHSFSPSEQMGILWNEYYGIGIWGRWKRERERDPLWGMQLYIRRLRCVKIMYFQGHLELGYSPKNMPLKCMAGICCRTILLISEATHIILVLKTRMKLCKENIASEGYSTRNRNGTCRKSLQLWDRSFGNWCGRDIVIDVYAKHR